MEQPGYYAVIPANVRYADITANAKLLYGEITALCSKEGYCWASNEHFAELYKTSERSITRWVDELVKLGVVRLVMIGKNTRHLYLDGQKRLSVMDNNVYPDRQKRLHSIKDNNKENTIAEGEEIVESVLEEESGRTRKVPRKDSEVLEVFRLVGGEKYPRLWERVPAQREAAKDLRARGIEQIQKAMDFLRENKGEKFIPKISSPYDLEAKWEKLLDFKESV